MKDISLLSRKLNIQVIGRVRYSPCDWLPKMDYLKTKDGDWYRYDVTSPPITREDCATLRDFIKWVETDHGNDWWIYSLRDKVVDTMVIEKLNKLLTTQSD